MQKKISFLWWTYPCKLILEINDLLVLITSIDNNDTKHNAAYVSISKAVIQKKKLKFYVSLCNLTNGHRPFLS